MGQFLTELQAQQHTDHSWKLLAPLVFQSELLTGMTIEVPAGYITDYASVPRLPVAYLLTGGIANKAAVVHDYLCTNYVAQRVLTWGFAARIFREAMKAEGVSTWRIVLMYNAVRIYGVFK